MEWTNEQEQQLVSLRDCGTTWEDISLRFGRTMEACRSKFRQMRPSEREPEKKIEHVKIEFPRVLLKAAVFDLETTNFDTSGYSGHLICCSILPLDRSEPECYSIRFEDNRIDKRLLKEVIERLSEYSILIGHNARAFDCNWLVSRAMYYGLPKLPSWLVYDTYQVAKNITLKVSKGLGNLGSYFGLDGEKTTIFKTDWSKIDSPLRWEFDKAIADITYHCREDVKLNRQLFDVLWAYDPQWKLPKTKW